MTRRFGITAGRAEALGAQLAGDGVNFAVFSDHAEAIWLCLFDEDGTESQRLRLPERTGGIWHGHVAGLGAGQRYGFRADGPYEPAHGHRFNVNKLLVDPYARALTGHPVWHDAVQGYRGHGADADLSFDPRDSAPYVPRSVVVDPAFDWGDDRPPGTSLSDTVIYEAHAKGLTRLHPDVPEPGMFTALGSAPMLEHLTRLGITAIELLPVQAFLNDRFLTRKGLVNYWGYQTLGFFAPEPRYLGPGGIDEVKRTIKALHGAGIEVYLDVVYNHTGESDQYGPTLCFRGLDNRSYYRLAPNPRHYINDTGTGNTLDLRHPMVLRMVMDSLRYWVEVVHVDGFRFDLATTLARGSAGFEADGAFLTALRQDPVLARVKLIAEPWDIGPGGYQLGAYPAPMLEWNDRYRDGVRRFWRNDPGMVPDLAARVAGSAREFDHSGRRATSSVNLLTAHDGFTLRDVTSYDRRHNAANGEHNRDGHGENHSDNMGVEGPSDDPAIEAARARRRRAMMATLMLSQGTPMLLAGDELGQTQGGNNNAYCQDNATAWIDWAGGDADMLAFTRALIAFRCDNPVLRQGRFLHGRARPGDGLPDLLWRRADAVPMAEADWGEAAGALLCVEIRPSAEAPPGDDADAVLYLVFNRGTEAAIALPPAPPGRRWIRALDSGPATLPDPVPVTSRDLSVSAQAVTVFTLGDAPTSD